jgi:hypothetical protein
MRRYIRNKHTGEYLKADGWTRYRWEATSFPTIPDAVCAGLSYQGEVELVVFVSITAQEIPFPIRDFEAPSL